MGVRVKFQIAEGEAAETWVLRWDPCRAEFNRFSRWFFVDDPREADRILDRMYPAPGSRRGASDHWENCGVEVIS